VKAGKSCCCILSRYGFTVNPIHVNVCFQQGTSMIQGFSNAFVAVLQFDVFSNQPNADMPFGILIPAKEILPLRQVGLRIIGLHPKLAQHHLIKPFFLHEQRNVINGVSINALNDGVGCHIAETSELGPNAWRQWMFCSAHQYIRLHPKFEQLLHGVLGWFGLQLTCCRQVGNQR